MINQAEIIASIQKLAANNQDITIVWFKSNKKLQIKQ